jgi:hypothetical protein
MASSLAEAFFHPGQVADVFEPYPRFCEGAGRQADRYASLFQPPEHTVELLQERSPIPKVARKKNIVPQAIAEEKLNCAGILLTVTMISPLRTFSAASFLANG